MQNMFLKITGPDLKGESVSDQGKDQIELFSFSHGVSMPISQSGASGVSVKHGRCVHQDFTVTKQLDKTSPALNLHCSGGTNFKNLTLTIFQADSDTAKPIEFYKIELDDVLITSVSVGGGGGDRPIETVTFHYNKIKWTYNPQKRDAGSGGAGAIPTGWDLEMNKKV